MLLLPLVAALCVLAVSGQSAEPKGRVLEVPGFGLTEVPKEATALQLEQGLNRDFSFRVDPQSFKISTTYSPKARAFVPPPLESLIPEEQPRKLLSLALASETMQWLQGWALALLAICLADVQLLIMGGQLNSIRQKMARLVWSLVTGAPLSLLALSMIVYVPSWHGLYLQEGMLMMFYLSLFALGLCLWMLCKLLWARFSPHVPLLWWVKLHPRRAIILAACCALVLSIALAPWRVRFREENRLVSERIVFHSIFSIPVISNPTSAQVASTVEYPLLLVEWVAITLLSGSAWFITKNRILLGSVLVKP